MWKCHKCSKPVFFAERKQSLGYDWHPECLRCEECGKRLNPGQHAEHKAVPYCHVPCYGALFGPQLFGHGTRVESHKSFGKATTKMTTSNGPSLPRDHLESKLKVYNQFHDSKSMEIRSREVNNRLIMEGALKVFWGVQGVIHLKEDDDQRTFVVRKRNSCRNSKAEDSLSDKENDASESVAAPSTTSEVDGLSTDVSLSESMTFDSCSLNEYPLSDLPSTPEEVSANTTGASITAAGSDAVALINGESSDNTDSTHTLCAGSETAASNSCISSTLPSNLEKLDKKQWDEFDDLLQVERKLNENEKVYGTMPVRLPSASPSSSSSSTVTSSESSPTKSVSVQNSTDSTNLASISNNTNVTNCSSTASSSASSSTNTTSSDNFLTATASLNTTTAASTTANTDTTTTGLDNYETTDDATLKPMDFEEFRRSVHMDYVNGANSFQEPNDDTLKRNQPIDPSRINDSLKFYGENMSKSFNCENALRSIDASIINDTLSMKTSNGSPHSAQRMYALQKSGSQNTASNHKAPSRHLFERGINRSKSGPSCFDYSDSDDDDTLKPQGTVRRSDVPPRFIQIKMNCYGKTSNGTDGGNSECESLTQSGAVGGDELSQTESISMATNGSATTAAADDEQALHITEDGVILRRPPRTGAAAIKRRSGNRRSRTKLKRRCSINGHYYNRETSFFTPPYGSQMSVWITSLVTTQEVINLVLEKYKVDSHPENFSLFVVRDNGEQKRLKDNEYPLISRVMLGPHEEVARIFLVDSRKTAEISNEVAQFLNLSLPECRAILERYDQELEREVEKVREKYVELRRRITARMESLKVHL